MKKVTKMPKALYTRDTLSRIIALLDLIKRLKYPSLNRLVDALEYRGRVQALQSTHTDQRHYLPEGFLPVSNLF